MNVFRTVLFISKFSKGFFSNEVFKKLVTEQWPGLLIGSQTPTWTTTATKCYEVKGGGGKGAPRCVNSRRGEEFETMGR